MEKLLISKEKYVNSHKADRAEYSISNCITCICDHFNGKTSYWSTFIGFLRREPISCHRNDVRAVPWEPKNGDFFHELVLRFGHVHK